MPARPEILNLNKCKIKNNFKNIPVKNFTAKQKTQAKTP
jgi:hypothetical protein